MNDEHPNLAILQRFDPSNMAAASDVIAEDAVFHYFNPKLPDLQGDFIGPAGFRAFFEEIGKLTKGTFKVNPLFASAVGDELVFVHSKNTLVLENQKIETDVVIVFRILHGKISEVWDIPSVYTPKQIDLSAR